MLGRHLSSAILEPPWRISKNRRECTNYTCEGPSHILLASIVTVYQSETPSERPTSFLSTCSG